jgi:S-adenosylmethionine hydrolase
MGYTFSYATRLQTLLVGERVASRPRRRCHRDAKGFILALLVSAKAAAAGGGLVVLQSDFGDRDQAVAAMRGVIRGVSPTLVVDDLTHEIPAFNIWEAAYRLDAVVDYWPRGTVFVSVVDPGVGTARKSVVALLANGQFVVTPDNGTLTLVADRVGVTTLREIDESRHRLPGSEQSHTFHGRDVYAYMGALLASGKVEFDAVGRRVEEVTRLTYQGFNFEAGVVRGGIPVLDPQYGNVWTNIDAAAVRDVGLSPGGWAAVTITDGAGVIRFDAILPFANTFDEVHVGSPLLYVNSLGRLAVALNQGNFAARHNIVAGPAWGVVIAAREPPATNE